MLLQLSLCSIQHLFDFIYLRWFHKRAYCFYKNYYSPLRFSTETIYIHTVQQVNKLIKLTNNELSKALRIGDTSLSI